MPNDNGLGINAGNRSDPYAGDTVDPADEIESMFADAAPGDVVDVPPEPANVDEEDVPLPRTEPESDEPEGGEPQAPPEAGDALVTEGTTPEELEGEVEEEARLFADRFGKVEDLEKAYKEVQGGFTRMAQDLQRSDTEREQLEAFLTQQQAQLDQLTQAVTSQMAEQDPEFAERLARQTEINRQVNERMDAEFEDVDPEQEAYEQQMVRDQQIARANIAAFYQRSGVAPGSPEDAQIERAMQAMVGAGVPIDLRRAEHLDAVLEASRDENLLFELTLAPNAINVPNGISRLKGRLGATIPTTETAPSPEQETQPAPSKGPIRKRVEATVEVPDAGAPVPTAPGSQGDEYDDATRWYEKRYGKGLLFGSKR